MSNFIAVQTAQRSIKCDKSNKLIKAFSSYLEVDSIDTDRI